MGERVSTSLPCDDTHLFFFVQSDNKQKKARARERKERGMKCCSLFGVWV